MNLPDWGQLRDREHFVQFYGHDAQLLESVASHFHSALLAGDNVVFVGTYEHQHAVQQLLREEGWVLERLQEQGRYLPFHATELLERFMVDGWPDPDLFSAVIGDEIMCAQAGRRRVRIFGEMVALLWESGNKAAALRLEELWHELGEILAFSLFCAYPERLNFRQADIERICCAHSLVLPRGAEAQITNPLYTGPGCAGRGRLLSERA